MMDDGAFKEQYFQLKHDQDALLKQKEQLEAAFYEATDSHDAQQSRIAELERQLRETQEIAQIRAEEAAAAAELNTELEVARTELQKTKSIVLHKETELTQAKEELTFQSKLVEEERAQAEEYERRVAMEAEWASANTSEHIDDDLDFDEANNLATDLRFDAVDPAIFQQQQDEINRLMDLLDEEAERRAQLENELMEKRRNGSSSMNETLSMDLSMMGYTDSTGDAGDDDDDDDMLPDLPLDAELELAATVSEPPAAVDVKQQEPICTDAVVSPLRESVGAAEPPKDNVQPSIEPAAAMEVQENAVSAVPAQSVDSEPAQDVQNTDVDTHVGADSRDDSHSLYQQFPRFEASAIDATLQSNGNDIEKTARELQEMHNHVYANVNAPVNAPVKPAIKLSLKQRQQQILALKRAKQEAKLRQEQLEQQKRDAVERKRQRQVELRARQKGEHDRMLAEQARAERMRRNRDLDKQRQVLLQRQAYLKAQRQAYEEAQHRREQMLREREAKAAAAAAAAAAAHNKQRLSDGGAFKVVLPSQEKVYQALMLDDVQGAAKRIGLGVTFDGRISLKCTPTGIHLIPTVKRSHKSSSLGKAWEWRLHEVREIEYEDKLLNLDIWTSTGDESDRFCFKLTDKRVDGLEVFKVIKGFIDAETERQDASMARDMQKMELTKSGKLRDVDRQFMAELRINEEFLELMAKETCTSIRDLKANEEVFRRNFEMLGPKSNKKLQSLRKKKSNRQSFFRGGDKRDSRRQSASGSSPATVARAPPRAAPDSASSAPLYADAHDDDDDSASVPLHRQFHNTLPQQPQRRQAWQ